MTATPEVPMPRKSPIRLTGVLIAGLVFAAGTAIVATIRTGPAHWITDVIRVGGIAVLTVLVLQRRSWARWILAVWYGLAAFSFFVGTIQTSEYPGAVALLVVGGCLYVWAVFELVIAEFPGATGQGS